jgi:quercetin dioxygenase-like cupin family protein
MTLSRSFALAVAGLAALAASGAAPGAAGAATGAATSVTYIPGPVVASGFAKGAVLHEGPGYMIHASRRESPGQAEVHTRDTDIIYVLEGESTFVTGGSAVNARPTAAGEIRGASIEGGETRHLVKGDVIIVPNGTPHWFKEIKAPFLYYVVKVRDASGAAR